MTETDSGKKSIWKRFRNVFTANETFHENEVQANKLGTLVMALSGVVLVIVLILFSVGIFKTSKDLTGPLIQGIIETGAVTVICMIFKYDRKWLKWLLVIVMAVVYAGLDGVFTHKAAILMAIPVIFSARYFSRKLTVFTTVITSGTFFISTLWGSVNGLFDLNIVTLPEGTRMISKGGFLDQAVLDTGFDRKSLVWDAFVYNYIPKWMLFFIISLISMDIANKGRRMVLEQHERDVEKSLIESELDLARRIQSDMLVTAFPDDTAGNGFDIYASMTPAREVGGDFYDFFMIDDTRLGLVIADVSGKGIPAALFMTRAMTLIKASAGQWQRPEEVLADVNNKICENNDEEMFVTAWFGILDTVTGNLAAANGGHEYPLFRNAQEDFSMIKDKHGFVLGGLPGTTYTGYEMDMEPGSCIFLYTDGLAEAQSEAGVFFGTDRVLDVLNKEPCASPEKIISGMARAVKDFTGDARQFDDLTMMCVRFTGRCKRTLRVAADIENIEKVTELVGEVLKGTDCSCQVRDKINVAVDEIFSNIAKYAYAPGKGDVTVSAETDKDRESITVTFKDNGKKYDPLEVNDPDVSLSADERTPGGLGVYMVRKLMDDVSYEYKDGQNILKIKKIIK